MARCRRPLLLWGRTGFAVSRLRLSYSAALVVATLVVAIPLRAATPPAIAGIVERSAATPFRITSSGSHPWLTVSDNGTGHVVWNQSQSGQNDSTHYCQIGRGQTACSRTQTFSPLGAGPYDFSGPKIVLTDQGDLVLLTNRCCSGNVGTYGYVSTNGGSSFGSQQRLGSNDPSGDAEFGPGAYSVTTVTDTETLGLFAQSVEFEGGSFVSEKARLNSDAPGSAIYDGSVAMVNPTTPIVAFSDRQSIYYRRWSGSGDVNSAASWLPTQKFGAGSFPRLTSGPKGVFMFYATGNSGTGDYEVARYDSNTGRFSSPTRLDTKVDAWVNRQDIWEDASGNLHAVWRRENASGDHLEYAVSRDGLTWSSPVALATASGLDDLHVRTSRDGGGYASGRSQMVRSGGFRSRRWAQEAEGEEAVRPSFASGSRWHLRRKAASSGLATRT
jgi:hypothetical protein